MNQKTFWNLWWRQSQKPIFVRSVKGLEERLKRSRTIPEENCAASSAKELEEETLRWLERLTGKPKPIEPPKGSNHGVTDLFAGQIELHMPDEERALQREAAVYAGRCPGCGAKPHLWRHRTGIFELRCRYPGHVKPGEKPCTFPKPEPQKDPHKLIRIWNLSLKLSQG